MKPGKSCANFHQNELALNYYSQEGPWNNRFRESFSSYFYFISAHLGRMCPWDFLSSSTSLESSLYHELSPTSYRVMVLRKGTDHILTVWWGSFFRNISCRVLFLPLVFIKPTLVTLDQQLVTTWLTPCDIAGDCVWCKVIRTSDVFVPGERSFIIMKHQARMYLLVVPMELSDEL